MCSCAEKKGQVDRHKDDLCHKKICKYPGIDYIETCSHVVDVVISGFNLTIQEKYDMRIIEISEGFKLF